MANVDDYSFSVSIIPHTAKETILSHKSVGDSVNLENDVIGKYVDKLINFKNENNKVESNITREFLIKNGLLGGINMFKFNTIEEAIEDIEKEK